jgi:hypothetical protein
VAAVVAESEARMHDYPAARALDTHIRVMGRSIDSRMDTALMRDRMLLLSSMMGGLVVRRSVVNSRVMHRRDAPLLPRKELDETYDYEDSTHKDEERHPLYPCAA